MLALVTPGKQGASTHTKTPVELSSSLTNPLVLAVDTPPEEEGPVELPYPFTDNTFDEPIFNSNHPLQLNEPSNIKTDVIYDPKSKEYLFEQKIGNLDYRPPITMSEEDYQYYMFKEQVKSHWKSRIQADNMNSASSRLIPKLTVGGEIFDRIFGGNTVDIRPNGSAELTFGLVINKNQNPALPVKQRRISNFDFNMKVQLNLIGKIGEKLKLTTNYNTEASFDFENQMKLEYSGLEDEILKKIEAGNVNLPLNSSLITGSQSLFGIKTQMQFGRLTATTVLSQQRGKKTEVTVQGGSQTSSFNVNADNYEANRHFFLSQYFRDHYNEWMANVPLISSPIVITKMEVWVTNRTSQVDQARNLVCFTDLGEDTSKVTPSLLWNPLIGCQPTSSQYAIRDSLGDLPSNGANSLYHIISNQVDGLLKDRNYADASNTLKSNNATLSNSCNFNNQYMESGRDFEVLLRARKLQNTEYKVNNRLGFISLNQALNYDEVLAVSFQYTYNGQTYQVGEFSDQLPNGDQPLYLKMLKSTTVNTRIPIWDLMMKNVYSIGAYQINPQDFKLEVFRNTKGVDLPYISEDPIDGKPLVQVMGLDRINVNGDRIQDGFFDFVEGVTILSATGRVFFPTIEPFGNDLRPQFGSNNSPSINEYIFQELYDSTKIAAQQITKKNVYKMKGTYKSSSSSEISLNSMNIPQGSVTVTAGGVPLTENIDYTVDYQLGRVKIINESILNSGQPIKVSAENNSMFNIQQKSLIGTRLDYKVNKDFSVGGTIMRLTERPLTQKVNIGDEPISNTIWGMDFSHRTDAPWLTRLVDKIPLINTKEMSSIQTAGEFAHLIPGHNKAIGKTGNSYVDDFEGSISQIDLRNQAAWFHSSVPQGQDDIFPEASLDSTKSGFNRAKLAWYTVDQSVFYQDQGITPGNITKDVKSNNFMRQIIETEIFPNKQPPNGQPVLLPVLDLAYYPKEKGIYNFDVSPTPFSKGIDLLNSNPTNGILLNNPETRWAGIMRRLETNDFQSANIEFIQFWMMDPFNEDYQEAFPGQSIPANGELYLNIGNVSEDILKDGRMGFENGLPRDENSSGATVLEETPWGKVPTVPMIVLAFDNNESARPFQDVGYDGMRNADEVNYYANQYLNKINALPGGSSAYQTALQDPSADDYNFYRDDDFDANPIANTIYRYKWYNGVDGNSPTEAQYNSINTSGGPYPTTATNLPNVEDINRDNTLSETESYYQYKIKITPQDINPQNVGNNFITNAYQATFTDANNDPRTVYWYQFKVPIVSYEKKVGSIEGFNSIRFMRMFFKNFSAPVICRMARMELVRSDWRRYDAANADPGDYIATDYDQTSFDISAVNIQENGYRTPVNYVLPPGIEQQQNVQTTNLVLLNEQALVLRTCGLQDGYARAAYKNMEMDVRSFKKIKMFVHAEKIGDNPLQDDDMQVFVRVGTDFSSNYYEYILPLKLTTPGFYDPNNENDRYSVWPESNEVVIDFEQITSLKLKRPIGSITTVEQTIEGGKKIRLVGNPSISNVRTIMVGIRNPKDLQGETKCVEVWINELRLTDFIQSSGWAANGRVTAKLADFGQVALSGAYMTPFFGSIEKKVSERSRETNFQYDASTSLQLGKFFPETWKLNLPFYINRAEIISTPQYDPSNPDVLMSAINSDNGFTKDEIRNIRSRGQDYTLRKGYNFTNVSKGRGKNKNKSYPWDIENFSLTYAYTEQYRRNITIENSIQKNYRGSLAYNYQNQVKPWKPFANSKAKWLGNKWFALIKDFNLTPVPSRLGFNTDLNRTYNEIQNRNISTDVSIPAQFNKTFNMSRNYDLKWDLSKGIRFDYTAHNDGRILEPEGRIDTQEEKDVIKNNLMQFGINTSYRQSANVTWTIPINKIPLFDFITSTYSYKTNYTWTRRPFAADSLGNTIQNGNTHSINGQFNMNTLYNKIPYFKRINTGQKKKDDKNSSKSTSAKDTAKNKEQSFNLLEHIARFIMTVKQVQVTYSNNNGTLLPGYIDSTQIMGMSLNSPNLSPGLGFVFGSQRDILATAEENQWLIKRQNLANPYSRTSTKNLSYTAKMEPFRDFRIELSGTRTYGENNGLFVGYDPVNDRYTRNTITQSGNFSISTIAIFSAFEKDDEVTYSNSVYEKFRAIRGDFAQLLAENNPNSTKALNLLGGGYDGYSLTQQDVILYSFLAAYTGKSVGETKQNIFPKVPLPNWTLTYDGLGKIKALKKHFKSITLRHSYRSNFNMGSFSNNILFEDLDGDGWTDIRLNGGNSNFVSKYQINTVSISENFSPLVKVDVNFNKNGLTGNFEMKKDRNINLNSNIPQITEVRGNEFIIGAGYRYPQLELKKIKVKGKPVKSDLNFKVDLSIRRNITIQRRVIDGINIPSQGQNVITLKTSVDYVISNNINVRFFFDRIMNKPVVSTSFPTANTNTGISLRFNLGGQ